MSSSGRNWTLREAWEDALGEVEREGEILLVAPPPCLQGEENCCAPSYPGGATRCEGWAIRKDDRGRKIASYVEIIRYGKGHSYHMEFQWIPGSGVPPPEIAREIME